MIMDDVFRQRKKKWNNLIKIRKGKNEVTKTCPGCGEEIKADDLSEALNVCPKCNYYFPMNWKERVKLICDDKSFSDISINEKLSIKKGANTEGFYEMYSDLQSTDPLEFPGYEDKLRELRDKTDMLDACVVGTGCIKKIKIALGILDNSFLMGSMGVVVGEKIARIAEYAKNNKLPLIIVSSSGGARMQEGLFSLMQMAKTSSAIEDFKTSGGLFISCLTNPTTGGVSASFASLGDIIIAEPNALLCFAGPRVIEQTIGQSLPEGFQRSEFLLEHGMIDKIVQRKNLRNMLYQILKMHKEELRTWN